VEMVVVETRAARDVVSLLCPRLHDLYDCYALPCNEFAFTTSKR
jgi:hypothetical protein